MTQRLIDQPSGYGEVYEGEEPRGAVRYSLSVYQSYGSEREQTTPGIVEIIGRLDPTGSMNLAELFERRADLTLLLTDGRRLDVQLRDARGNVVAIGGRGFYGSHAHT